MSELRELIAREAVGAEELGVPVGTLNMWTRGAVPAGAPPFPPVVKIIGKGRVYCRTEAEEWISAWYRPRS